VFLSPRKEVAVAGMTTRTSAGAVIASASALVVQSEYSPSPPWRRYSTGNRAAGSSANPSGSRIRAWTVPTDGDSMVTSRIRPSRVSTLTIRAPSSAAWPIVG
jgi:hypothetical protein